MDGRSRSVSHAIVQASPLAGHKEMDSASARAYENHAQKFLDQRDRSTIGVGVVQQWAKSLPGGSEVLEIAWVGGIPVTRTLAAAGLRRWAVDSSPTLVAEFFPGEISGLMGPHRLVLREEDAIDIHLSLTACTCSRLTA